jgi:hypothetical protein
VEDEGAVGKRADRRRRRIDHHAGAAAARVDGHLAGVRGAADVVVVGHEDGDVVGRRAADTFDHQVVVDPLDRQLVWCYAAGIVEDAVAAAAVDGHAIHAGLQKRAGEAAVGLPGLEYQRHDLPVGTSCSPSCRATIGGTPNDVGVEGS